MPGVEQVPYLTNVSMMDVDFLPEHLLVVGGSYIGLEFGQMYRRFGSRVTIVEMGPRLIGREDEDVSEAVQEIVEAEGVEVRLDAECIRLEQRRRRRRDRLGLRGGRAEGRGAPTSSSPWAACRTPMISGSDAPASRPTSAATSRWTSSCAPQIRTCGRSATATAKARSPTPRTTTTRSSPTTCSQRRPQVDGPHPGVRALHRSAARARRHDRGRDTQERASRRWSASGR